jgi:RNA polymerase sigma-70 factor (ECF subfamily)
MEPEKLDPHLSRITTEWDMVFKASAGGPATEVSEAQSALMARYAGAVHRFLLAGLRDPDAASELNQEFALRFLRGDFHRADPARGRFRDFLKRALRNLMTDYHRRRRTRPQPLGDRLPDVAGAEPDLADFDREFLSSWRKELLSRATAALAGFQKRTARPYHTVLCLRVEHPELKSAEMAERLSQRLGKAVSDIWVRQTLSRARDRFAGFLLDEVAASLDSPTIERIEQELIEVRLIDYCRTALQRRAAGPPSP